MRKIQLEQLLYIIEVANQGKISQAAEKLLISQSALSQSILKLEDELNIKIFKRHRNGVTPTKEGQFIINHAIELKKIVDNIETFSKTVNSDKYNDIKIGVVEGLHLNFIPNFFSKLRKQFPYTNFGFTELNSVNICKELINKNIDIGLLAIYDQTKVHKEKIKFIKLRKINMYVFVSKYSDLANKDVLYPEDLSNESFITYNGEYMNWFFSKYKNRYGQFNELMTTKNNTMISKAVKDNIAIAIEVDTEIKNKNYIDTGDIIAKPLKLDDSFYNNYLGLGYLPDNKKMTNKGLDEIINILENEVLNL